MKQRTISVLLVILITSNFASSVANAAGRRRSGLSRTNEQNYPDMDLLPSTDPQPFDPFHEVELNVDRELDLESLPTEFPEIAPLGSDENPDLALSTGEPKVQEEPQPWNDSVSRSAVGNSGASIRNENNLPGRIQEWSREMELRKRPDKPTSAVPVFGIKDWKGSPYNLTHLSTSSEAMASLKSSIQSVTSHTKQFIVDTEGLNNKAFKSMSDFLKQPPTTGNPMKEFLAILDSWKQVCSGAEEVTENFLHKMSLISTKHASRAVSEWVLEEVKVYVQTYTATILKRHITAMDLAFDLVGNTEYQVYRSEALRKLMEYNSFINEQSMKTINNYLDLLSRLVTKPAYTVKP